MEAIRRVREHDLLGHAPRDPFSGEEVRQRIGTDFSDVFGGPPRRFSLCETRSSLGESGEDSESGGRLEVEDAGESSQRWSPSLAEKPVFGGFSSPAHRRHLGDDFFSDIFRGNESPCSTPRKLDRERFAATPSSSFLSPSRPLPPTADVFGGDPSTPNLSYSSRLAKNFDYSPFSSPTSRAAQKTEESTPRAFDVPSPNSPSRFTHATDGLATNSRRAPPSHRPAEAAAVPPGDGTRGAENLPMKEDSNSKDNSGSDHLHFSMYKWASKGVTLVMPPNLKERIKGRSRLGGVYAQVSQQPDLPSDKENMPQGIPIFQNQGEPEEKTLFGNPPPAENNKAASPKEAAKVLRDITDQSEDAGVCGKDGSGFSVEARKPGLKNLRHLLDDDLDKEGNEDTSKHAKEREGTAPDSRRATKVTDSTAKPRQGTREEPGLDSYEKTNLASHRPVRIKGKVKESMKNFEPRRSGPRENMNGRVEDRPSAQEVNKDEAKGIYEASSVPVAPTGQNLKAERAASFKNSGVQKLDGFFSEVDSDSVTFSDYTINSLDASFNKIEVTDFEHVEDCMLEDLSQDHNEVSEANLHQEEIQKSDAKILEWSKGREGNIRSLLSTLQYVLWPGSGWKPVPLVDIIEAPSVRRAYQRALLYIHPDKLQQKGADIHRKYVAEKVFDILQEAWDHFNSLGAL